MNVDCQDVAALLSAEIDQQLSPEESAQVRAHLPFCPECARRYALLRDTRTAFASLAAGPVVRPRHVTGALVVVTLAAVVVRVAVLRSPTLPPKPLRNANAGLDCGVIGSTECLIETPPCGGAECAPEQPE